MEKMTVYFIVCTQCGRTVGGPYVTESDAMAAALSMKECPKCGESFSVYLPDMDRPWNFDIVSLQVSTIEAIVGLIKSYFNIKKQQIIFGYRDKGPESEGYRYPSVRIRVKKHPPTERASPAVCVYIHDKDSDKIIDGYCFADPYALVQLACELISSAKWLKDQVKG